MGGTGVSRSQVSRLCAEIDDKVKAFLDRPLEGDCPRIKMLWGLAAAKIGILTVVQHVSRSIR